MKLRLTIFLIIFILTSISYFFGSEAQVFLNQTLYLIFPVGCALIGTYVSIKYGHNNAIGRAQWLMTLGFITCAIGEIIWYVLKNIMGIESPYPSIVDFFCILGYPFFGAGLYQAFVMAEIDLKKVKKSYWVIGILTTIILTALVGYFNMYQAYDPQASVLTNITSLSYGVGDLIMVVVSLATVLIAKEYAGGKFSLFWNAMAAGFFIFLISDLLFTIYYEQYALDTKPYIYIDLVFVAGFMIQAYALMENYFHISEIQKNIKLKLQQRK